jgi:glycosyltransferase involved in cell wall biosynthesis
MSIKVSIIIPVYNAEKYLVECIESLLVQTLKECEFIFINDGSKDNCLEILERYKKMDSRIIHINQENQGVSSARNNGLSVATGEFVGFVDADDYIEKDMYEVLYNTAKQSDCDVVISNFENEIEGKKVIIKYPFLSNDTLKKEYIEQEVLPYFLRTDNLNTVCNKIFNNQIIKKNKIQFPEKIALGEDGLFNITFFYHATSMKYINYSGYHYRDVDGSATRNISEKDYFSRAIEVYTLELPERYIRKIDKKKIHQLKSIKLLQSVMSYVHVYFTPTKELSFRIRYKYVKNMINNKYVKEALPLFLCESYNYLGRYEKCIIDLIKRKSTFGLYCVTAYSRLRNR